MDGLAAAALLDETCEVVVEKPFGSSSQGAQRLSAALQVHLKPSQLHLMDHYLGKAGLWYFRVAAEDAAFRSLLPFVRGVDIEALEVLDTGATALL